MDHIESVGSRIFSSVERAKERSSRSYRVDPLSMCWWIISKGTRIALIRAPFIERNTLMRKLDSSGMPNNWRTKLRPQTVRPWVTVGGLVLAAIGVGEAFGKQYTFATTLLAGLVVLLLVADLWLYNASSYLLEGRIEGLLQDVNEEQQRYEALLKRNDKLEREQQEFASLLKEAYTQDRQGTNLQARVVSPGRYQVQSTFGKWYNIHWNSSGLACECRLYATCNECPHSAKARRMHEVVIKTGQQPSSTTDNLGPWLR